MIGNILYYSGFGFAALLAIGFLINDYFRMRK